MSSSVWPINGFGSPGANLFLERAQIVAADILLFPSSLYGMRVSEDPKAVSIELNERLRRRHRPKNTGGTNENIRCHIYGLNP